jgi:hypothetical protein
MEFAYTVVLQSLTQKFYFTGNIVTTETSVLHSLVFSEWYVPLVLAMLGALRLL